MMHFNTAVTDHESQSLQVLRTMLTYREWKEKYVTSNEQGLYVSYNAQGHSQPADAVTVSEASG